MTHRNGIGLAVGNFDAESLAEKVKTSADMGYDAIEVHGRFLADTPPDDLGHMNMMLREPKHDSQPLEPNAVESYIRRIPLTIAETHIHSNDGSEDQHLPPYMGNTDFEEAARALNEVGFEGIHTIEIVPGPDGLPREEILPAASKSILYWRDFLNRT